MSDSESESESDASYESEASSENESELESDIESELESEVESEVDGKILVHQYEEDLQKKKEKHDRTMLFIKQKEANPNMEFDDD